MGCGHDCGGCGGCGGGALELTEQEVELLGRFAQLPFLPVARKRDDDIPVYLEEGAPEDVSVLLQCLEKKGLISLDFDKPLSGFDDGAYAAYPVRGSMALTQRGQQVLQLVEYQGVTV